MKLYVLLLLVVGALLAGMLGGCQERFTRPRYDTVTTGLTESQVVDRIGKPDSRFQNRWVFTHEEPFYRAVIEFHNGRVIRKEWFDEPQEGDPQHSLPGLSRMAAGRHE